MGGTTEIRHRTDVADRLGRIADDGAGAEQLFGADNITLSTITRFHNKARLAFLAEALASLARQHWPNLETIVVLQNPTDELRQQVEEIINRQQWPAAHRYQLLSVRVAEGVDARSRLLNLGIEHAAGRYLAFLDDDDVVYVAGYTTLLQQLKDSQCAVALGGCCMNRLEYNFDHWVTIARETPFAWGRTRYDLFKDNFVPINSYVLDRARISPLDLRFDETLTLLEDYEFLLRLCAKYEFDFSRLDTFVCEYRVRQDNSNSIPYGPNPPLEAQMAHRRAHEIIDQKKAHIISSVSVSVLADLQRQLIAQQEQIIAQQELIIKYEQAKLAEDNRFLMSVIRETYNFLGRFPRLERQLSHLVHFAWGRDRNSS